MHLPNFTEAQILQQLVSGFRWYGLSISYAFPASAESTTQSYGEGVGFAPLTVQQQQLARVALQAWDDLIAPTLFESIFARSNLELAYTSTGIDYAHAYYPTEGTVWFSSDAESLAQPSLGGYGFMTYVHEIGHALGLDHMGSYDGQGDWQPSSYEDSTVYSVMSYFGPDHMNTDSGVADADWTAADGELYSPQTPMLNDILAIQSIYGAGEARPADTTYGFYSNVIGSMSSIFNFNDNKNPVLTIYDTGGSDTLNLSRWSTDSVISLLPGTFSSCNAMTNNLAIERHTVLENCSTGSGNDRIIGNSSNNRLFGNAGNDSLTGGSGNDILDGGMGMDITIYSRAHSDYAITYSPQSDVFTIQDLSGADGTDTLHNIEKIEFSDTTSDIRNFNSSVFRYYNPLTQTHLYTNSLSDMALLEDVYTDYQFEKAVFRSASSTAADAVDVYRFYNAITNGHLYTSNKDDINILESSYPEFKNEGIAFQAHGTASADTAPLYRFFSPSIGAHFYTASQQEFDYVKTELAGTYKFEGIAFYVEL